MVDKKILVVEDESIVAMHISESLKKMGYSVPAIAVSGEDAVMKALEIKPDLILMDIVLTRHDRLESKKCYRQKTFRCAEI
ncbi:MAG: response regulator [Candidatus Firestonebacteria bacterium]|nr:response regulator [Candidatus Firestonebacteria bacterium]